jgi:hypothetical protein
MEIDAEGEHRRDPDTAAARRMPCPVSVALFCWCLAGQYEQVSGIAIICRQRVHAEQLERAGNRHSEIKCGNAHGMSFDIGYLMQNGMDKRLRFALWIARNHRCRK